MRMHYAAEKRVTDELLCLANLPGVSDVNRVNSPREPQRSWVGLVFRDIHFWVPVAVLIGGLIVLRWIS
jgi:hypothetical protein